MVAHDNETDGTHKLYKNFLVRFFTKLNFKLADKIIVQNQFQNKNLLNKHFKTYLLKSSYPIGESLLDKSGFILWVGRSESWKRPELFLELAKIMPLEQFVMICAPSTDHPELSEDLKRVSKTIYNLKFIEFVPFQQINDYFGRAKVFINTSVQEGFPNTFIQAAKNKTPVLSLNVNPDDCITSYNWGFYCNNDFDLLVNNLQKILFDNDLYYQMRENAYRYVQENHDIKVNAEKFLEIITR